MLSIINQNCHEGIAVTNKWRKERREGQYYEPKCWIVTHE